jgi:hypothetical protein
MDNLCRHLGTCLIALATWWAPQPRYSQGWLVVYGSQRTTEINARFHGYRLSDLPDQCGIASISPAHLGEIAWISTDQLDWIQCRVIDVGAWPDMPWLLDHHEIAEIPDWACRRLGCPVQADGLVHGKRGFLWRGACPPSAEAVPESYDPRQPGYPQATGPFNYNRGYPPAQPPTDCALHWPNVGRNQ